MDSYLLQLAIIIPYWLGGIALGALLKAFQKDNMDKMLLKLSSYKSTLLMLIVSSTLGAVSPITLFGVIPIIYSIDIKINKKMEPLILAFITSSILISPNIFVFTLSLGTDIAIIRLLSTIAIGVIMGLISDVMLSSNKTFLNLKESKAQEADRPNKKEEKKAKFFLRNFYYAFKKTGFNLLIGITLSFALFAFVPQSFYDMTFDNNAIAVHISAVLGTFLYQCGGGSIPILQGLMREGLSTGAAITFMLVGPLTKLTNLTALKSIMTIKKLLIYCGIMLVYMLTLGWILG